MNYKEITLIGWAKVRVDMDAKPTICKKCKKSIRFGITKNGKYMPIIETANGWASHFADCVAAASFRKPKTEERIEEEQKNQDFLSNI